jgi:hypothetical protein
MIARDRTISWYDSCESSHDSGQYVPHGVWYEDMYYHISIQGMLDNFSKLMNHMYKSTCTIDFGFLHMIEVRDDFLRLTSKVRFTYPFWTIQDRYQMHKTVTIEFLTYLRLLENEGRRKHIKST